ncbi:TELO2-interacting protein 1-like [Silurus asotus]|uniref:TELO2-interacting protein 1 homolog n=1 Tax=Silurus asotus TaxID=30991 RepID=A0AAD5A3G2_SILAS|nr:TELO2-interacting protein 1-like [Silurus asotus]
MADHQINDPKIAFAYLRPSCVLLTKEPTLSNIEALNGHLRCVSDGVLQLFQDYVLFPLRFVLKMPGAKREGIVQAVMDAMTYVLQTTCIQNWESLRDLFSELCLCLCLPNDPGKPAPSSEELKLSVLRCLNALMHSAYGDVVFGLYKPAMLPGLGAAVSLFLALAEQEKAREVQASALRCLLSLFLQCDCERTHVEADEGERILLGNTLASFLPGITRALSLVISGDVRQGHMVTVKAMRGLYTTVGLVMADTQLQNNSTASAESPELGRIGDLVVKRTPSWSKSTSKRLALALQKVISYTAGHPHWRVRLELVNLSDHLLTRCSKSLPECIGHLLDALVGAVNDEEPRVKERCSEVLAEVSRRNQGTGGQALNDVLSENLHSLASSLPRLMRTTDDNRKLFTLTVFLGYLKILGPQVDFVLRSAVHLERISKALLQVLELDVSDVRIVEERSFAPLSGLAPDAPEVQHQRKYFLYFTDDKIFLVLKQVCRMLGRYGNLYLLVDHFSELYKESSVYRKQAALVLNELISGAAGVGLENEDGSEIPRGSHDDLKSVIASVIEEYISLNNWHLASVMDDSEKEDPQEKHHSAVSSSLSRADKNQLTPSFSSKDPTLTQLNSNIWQICIQLEGISSFALALGSDFRLLLMTSLYPVLEKAGDTSLLVSQSALCTLHDICVACDYDSPKELVIRNADYLLNDVSLNLNRPSIHPHAPRVLAVMFAHSDAALLPLVADVVQDVLTALDLSYDQRSGQFCAVLHSLMKALVRWFNTSAANRRKTSIARGNTQTSEALNLHQFLLDYRKQKDLAEGIGVEEEEGAESETPAAPELKEEEDEGEEGPDVKPELPLHVSLTKDVMERCIHLLSHPNMGVRLKVLDIVELCVTVLCEMENELLPMVHRCWPALLQRLTNDDPLAIPRAFRVLCMLGETCGDFLRKRVSKEVLPRLTSALSRQAETSARSGPVYTHTLAYKLQVAVLQGLGPLCVRLDLVDSDLDHILEACLPYLSVRQPIRLQEACLSVFRHVMQLDPDLCWLMLSEWFCPSSYEPPHALLFSVIPSGTSRARNEYTHNVLTLLQELEPHQEIHQHQEW